MPKLHQTIPISATIITFNEANNIGRCLTAIQTLVQEIIVVDSGSTDNTVQICKNYGAHIYDRPFEGYGNQKRFAIEKASNDWVLALDADEVVTPQLKDEILRIFSLPAPLPTGFYTPRTLVFMNKIFRFGVEKRNPCLKLFNRNHGHCTEQVVHEKIQVRGPTKILDGELLHYSYPSITSYFHKFNKYTSLAAEQWHKSRKTSSKSTIFFRFPLSFTQHYFLYRNFLNGLPGFIWSLFSALYPVVKYAKLHEMQRSR